VRLFGRIIEPWEYIRAEPGEIRRLDDGAYLVKGELHSKHSTAAGEIVTPYEQRFEIEEGLLVRARVTFGRLGSAGSNDATAAAAGRGA
jgi:hypothetical protein